MARSRSRRRRFRREPGVLPAYTLKAPHRHSHRIARHDLPRGFCRVCTIAVALGSRGRIRSWHDGRALAGGEREPNCLHTYKIATNPKYAKFAIAKRDGRRCRSCGETRGRSYAHFHLDHVLPLADGGSATEDNMQLLCPDCHTAKTAKEATARAAARREAA